MNETPTAFDPYVRHLQGLAMRALAGGISPDESAVINALGDEPSDELARTLRVADRKQGGIYFTGDVLARSLTEDLLPSHTHSIRIHDPACGVGDLLLKGASLLPVQSTLRDTLSDWRQTLSGTDLSGSFTAAARARLMIYAYVRWSHQMQRVDRCDAIGFPQIRKANGLRTRKALSDATHVVLNPPYTMVPAPPGCSWASGKVNLAALFVEHALTHVTNGTEIRALLPDVLRSGSRYERWRKLIEDKGAIHAVRLHGQFSDNADVDVFELHMTASVSSKSMGDAWYPRTSPGILTIGELFIVRVGPVVPHRDPIAGPEAPYITAQGLPKWVTVRNIETRRRFSGTLYEPPFIVVRRTSRSDDENRLIPTLVVGPDKVAVENHLVILQPRDKQLKTCRSLVKSLRSPTVTNWLNQRIRCRHLTVSAIKEMPLPVGTP